MKMGGALFQEVLAITPAEYVEPEMHEGSFEVTGYFVNDFEKKIYTLMRRIQAEMEKFDPEDLKDGAKRKQISVLMDQVTALRHMFYFFISDRLKIWDTNLSVSRGWKIIIPEVKDERPAATTVVISAEALKVILEKMRAEQGKDPANDPFSNMSDTMH